MEHKYLYLGDCITEFNEFSLEFRHPGAASQIPLSPMTHTCVSHVMLSFAVDLIFSHVWLVGLSKKKTPYHCLSGFLTDDYLELEAYFTINGDNHFEFLWRDSTEAAASRSAKVKAAAKKHKHSKKKGHRQSQADAETSDSDDDETPTLLTIRGVHAAIAVRWQLVAPPTSCRECWWSHACYILCFRMPTAKQCLVALPDILILCGLGSTGATANCSEAPTRAQGQKETQRQVVAVAAARMLIQALHPPIWQRETLLILATALLSCSTSIMLHRQSRASRSVLHCRLGNMHLLAGWNSLINGSPSAQSQVDMGFTLTHNGQFVDITLEALNNSWLDSGFIRFLARPLVNLKKFKHSLLDTFRLSIGVGDG